MPSSDNFYPLSITSTPAYWPVSNQAIYQGTYPIYQGIYPGYNTTTTTPVFLPQPDALTLSAEVIEALFGKMITVVGEDEKVIVCVDPDVPDADQSRIAARLTELDFKGIVITGARAGKGLPLERLPSPEEERVDILARIGEIWSHRPDLRLTDLLSWYTGGPMEDRDFAAAVEVHFEKVTDGAYTRP